MQDPFGQINQVIIKEDGVMYTWKEGKTEGEKSLFSPEQIWEQKYATTFLIQNTSEMKTYKL